jgi:hypothetical protein
MALNIYLCTFPTNAVYSNNQEIYWAEVRLQVEQLFGAVAKLLGSGTSVRVEYRNVRIPPAKLLVGARSGPSPKAPPLPPELMLNQGDLLAYVLPSDRQSMSVLATFDIEMAAGADKKEAKDSSLLCRPTHIKNARVNGYTFQPPNSAKYCSEVYLDNVMLSNPFLSIANASEARVGSEYSRRIAVVIFHELMHNAGKMGDEMHHAKNLGPLAMSDVMQRSEENYSASFAAMAGWVRSNNVPMQFTEGYRLIQDYGTEFLS